MFILSYVHNGKLWLEQPIQITKKMIYRIIGFPILNKAKTTKTLSRVELENKTLSKLDGRGMKINNVTDMELKFGIHVITHKIYNSIHLKNVSCEAIDLALKVVKNNMSFNLAELMMKQFNKNMESIKNSKKFLCKFGSLLTCLFFYVQKFFPSKGSVIWRKDVPIYIRLMNIQQRWVKNLLVSWTTILIHSRKR